MMLPWSLGSCQGAFQAALYIFPCTPSRDNPGNSISRLFLQHLHHWPRSGNGSPAAAVLIPSLFLTILSLHLPSCKDVHKGSWTSPQEEAGFGCQAMLPSACTQRVGLAMENQPLPTERGIAPSVHPSVLLPRAVALCQAGSFCASCLCGQTLSVLFINPVSHRAAALD